MATMVMFPDAKMTKADGTLLRRGKFYSYVPDDDESVTDLEFENLTIGKSVARAQFLGHLKNFVPSMQTGFAIKFDWSIPPDYAQISPYTVVGFGGPKEIFFSPAATSEQPLILRFYPDATDNSWYMEIQVPDHNHSYIIKLVRTGNNAVNITMRSAGAFGQWRGGERDCLISIFTIPWIGLHNDHPVFYGTDYNPCLAQYYLLQPGKAEPKHVSIIRWRWDYDYRIIEKWIGTYVPEDYDTGNPYAPGGKSDEGGGEGNFSEESDSVDTDVMPTINAVGTGFATLFTPTKQQLKALADVMWDSNIFTALQNLVENITGMFTSLAIVPFDVLEGNTVEVNWFGLPITEILLTLASQQYYEFDMGSIDLANDNRIFTSGSALDYSPYSKLGIFLPFIGFQELDVDECRGTLMNLKYRIDILSGTCVALISLDGNTIYQFSGNCLSQIPITNENMQSLVSDAVNVGIAACATHSASGAASADMAAAKGAERISEGAKEAKVAHAQAHVASAAGQLSSATANAAMGMKPTFGKAGAISASASLLAVKQPYLFLTTPRQSMPNHYQRYCGFPSNISGKLSEFSGFTVVEDIRLNGLVATSPEVAEIYELLKKGVII